MIGDDRNPLANQSLNGVEEPLLVPVTECERNAFRTRSRRSTNAMNVAFWLVGNVVIDDMAYTIHINPTSGNVGCHQDSGFATLEVGKGGFAGIL